MKKLRYLTLFAILCPVFLLAQPATGEQKPVKKKPAKKERILVNLTAENWLQTAGYLETNPYNSRGIELAILYDYVIKKSPISLALGASVNSSNVFSNAFPVTYNTTNGGTFTKMDTAFFSGTSMVRSKVSLNYINIPFELRWRSKAYGKKPKRIAVSVGFKFGFLIQSHTKTITKNDFVVDAVNLGTKFKTYDIKNLNPIKYGVTFRAGYANFYATAYYGLSTVFQKGKGTPANVLSVGVGFSPL